MTLRELATHDLVVVHWTEKMQQAYQILLSSRIRHLPVVDDTGAIIGILSDRDFQRAMQNRRFEMTSSAQADFDAEAKVRDHMSWPVEVIEEDSSIADAARVMIDKKISSLIVARSSQPVGIVTSEDLLRSLFDREQESHELADDMRVAVYNSPIGQIAQALANAGI